MLKRIILPIIVLGAWLCASTAGAAVMLDPSKDSSGLFTFVKLSAGEGVVSTIDVDGVGSFSTDSFSISLSVPSRVAARLGDPIGSFSVLELLLDGGGLIPTKSSAREIDYLIDLDAGRSLLTLSADAPTSARGTWFIAAAEPTGSAPLLAREPGVLVLAGAALCVVALAQRLRRRRITARP